MKRGPGANEPQMILQRVKEGKSFDQAVAEVAQLCGFICEQWWIDLNRQPILEAAGLVKPEPEAARPEPKKGKG